MGTLQSLALTFVMEHNPSALNIGFDMNLLASAYAVRPSFHATKLYVYDYDKDQFTKH